MQIINQYLRRKYYLLSAVLSPYNIRKDLLKIRAGTIHRWAGASRYSNHDTQDTQHPYRDTIELGKPVFAQLLRSNKCPEHATDVVCLYLVDQ